jgi:hypothetical protein
MRRMMASAVALCAALTLATVAPVATAATQAGPATAAAGEERNYEVHAYGPVLGSAEGLTFQIRPQRHTWSLTIRLEGFEVPFFAGTYTTSGRLSTFTADSLERPVCDFTLLSGQSGSRYTGLSSCWLPHALFPIRGLFLLVET